MNEQPMDWKLFFASLSDEKLAEFSSIIGQEALKRRHSNSNLEPTYDELLLANSGKKIEAIKSYRRRTDAGLAEAKRMIEQHMGRF